VAKIKAHSLTGRITLSLLVTAFRNVKRNRGVAGIDKVSIQLFESNLLQNLLALMRRLKDRSYRALPLRRVYIPKGDGENRPLGIPAVCDRVAQEVLRLLLNPLFERIFHDDSYGFRPERNGHRAVERVLELHRQGYTHVLDADIKGFLEKFKTKIRAITQRKRNLDQEVVRRVNAVVRGTANYFATSFSNVWTLFRGLDGWIRMRFRAMKFKRKSRSDNWRLLRKHLRNLGFLFLSDARAPPAVALP
jgi:hypothetical protein